MEEYRKEGRLKVELRLKCDLENSSWLISQILKSVKATFMQIMQKKKKVDKKKMIEW